jgi:hypothetical protein
LTDEKGLAANPLLQLRSDVHAAYLAALAFAFAKVVSTDDAIKALAA